MGKPTNAEAISDEWNELHLRLDTLIKQGKHAEVRQVLMSKNPKKIPRAFAVPFGELAFRSHLPLFTLKVLHPFVHPENTFSTPATDKEKIIYATAIFSLGAVKDSLDILEGIDPNEEPEAHFYKALAYVCDWNYAGSVPHLKAYIASASTTAYRKLVGKVNLAAAYIQIENWNLAEQLLADIQSECESQSHGLLLGNCFELKSQLKFYQGCYDQALEHLDRAAIQLKDQDGRYSMLVEKGRVLCQLFQSRQSGTLQMLKAFQARALQLGHWDSIRDTDLFEAIFLRDEALTKKVIMGTPSEHYRQRARRLFGENFKMNGHYSWLLAKSPLGTNDIEKQSSFQFDPYQELQDKPAMLNLFDALTCDFYKPANIGFLFQKTHPHEKFNPFTSPPRILQLLRRLDAFLVETETPLRVVFKKSEFHLRVLQDTNILVRRGKPVSSASALIFQLREYFDGRSFTPAKAAEALNLSKSSVHRMIKEALAEGGLSKVGTGRGVNYRFARSKKMKDAA